MVRGLLQSLAWVIAIVMFVSRPCDDPAFVALVAAGIQWKDSNVAFLLFWLSASVLFITVVLYGADMMLDLTLCRRAEERVGGWDEGGDG